MIKKRKKIYKAKETSQFDKSKVQIYGEEIEEIAKRHGDDLTPAIIVAEAEKKSSPIHEVFEWDNNQASHFWRLQQARQLVNHIEVEIHYPEGEVKTTRAFVSIFYKDREGNAERNYIDIETVLEDESYRNLMTQQAMRDFVALRVKYEELNELLEIFTAIDGIQQQLELNI